MGTYSCGGKSSQRSSSTSSFIGKKTNSTETGIQSLEPHTSPVYHLLSFSLAFCNADVSWGWGKWVHITVGGRHLSPRELSGAGRLRLSSRAQRPAKGEGWQLKNGVISFLNNLFLPAYPHVSPACSPHLTCRHQSAVRVLHHRLLSCVSAGFWNSFGVSSATRV